MLGKYRIFIFLRLLRLIHVAKLLDLIDYVLERFQMVGIVFSTPVMRFVEHMLLLYLMGEVCGD